MILWHASPKKYRRSIEDAGLLVKHPHDGHWKSGLKRQPHGVYCMRTRQAAVQWAKNYKHIYGTTVFDIWRLDISNMLPTISDPELRRSWDWDRKAVVVLCDVPPYSISLSLEGVRA